MEEKPTFINGLEEESFEKDLNERILNANEAEQTTQENRVSKAMEMEVDDKQTKKEKILQMMMPSLRSHNSFKLRASRKLMRSRQRIM